MKQITLNVDDLGLAPAVNQAVLRLAEMGRIQSASFMSLGRIDAEGYLFITGRAKDLIIRGGHNIDPAIIEEALMVHPEISFVGAIGQPDAHSGEVPCVYVELTKGASVTQAALMAFATAHIHERAALLLVAPDLVALLRRHLLGALGQPALALLDLDGVVDRDDPALAR